MKNIHILPTDKPSRLSKQLDNPLELYKNHIENQKFGRWCINQNIYITSDEEIKDNTWVLNIIDGSIYKTYNGKNFNKDTEKEKWRKIILTTDQDLIKDGIQAIDDEFLQWFIKNPSCESIEVCKNPFYEESNYEHYKIIIPKEEPKQETFEEAAKRYDGENAASGVKSFKEGAKWQKERSEEDMKTAFKVGFSIGYGSDVHAIDEKNRTCEEWFEQLKNK
jgi:hypothetical protein